VWKLEESEAIMNGSELINVEDIQNRIYAIRGVQVMLDEDLALLYGVETRVLNQAVKRNKERFLGEFMFQLTENELNILKSQIVISSWGGRRTKPYVFTEQYPPIEIREFKNSHDRFIIIDNTAVYHFGASLKDLGKKWFAFSKMDIGAVEMLSRLEGVKA